MAKRHVLVDRRTGKRIALSGFRTSTQKPIRFSSYGASSFKSQHLPPKVDLRPYLTPVEDQSAANSCTANAIAGAYEYLAKRALGDAGDISRLFIYYNARKEDGIKGDQGSTIVGSINTLQKYGACTEGTWPYELTGINRKPPSTAYEEALWFLVDEARELEVTLETFKHCLAEGFPFVFGLRLFKSFDQARRSGRVPMPDPNTEAGRTSHGNHAMLCVGYSDHNQCFIVRNSWGEDWGDRGYCYIPYGYLSNPEYCWDCWSIQSVSELDFSAEISDEEDEEAFYDEDEEWDEEDGYDDEEEDYEDEDWEDDEEEEVDESEGEDGDLEEESEEDGDYEESEEDEGAEEDEEESEEEESDEDYEESEEEESDEDYEEEDSDEDYEESEDEESDGDYEETEDEEDYGEEE
ncbi:MAG: C1 family peptidase [Cyanobacteria bacterium]|nr:C1 family peptidase [Cyanobacteriota bacterium]